MEKIDYLFRENNTQKVYLTEETLDVIDILNENYHYLCESIKNEDFILKSGKCNLFKELVFENKVVGFCTYDFSREFITAALNNIYILPEFRGNHLFLEELKKTMKEHNKPSIMEPTRFIVERLIEYGFAKKINDHIVASAIEFVVPGEHLISNKDTDVEEELSTHFYDLNICASIHFLNLDECSIVYSFPLNDDIKRYDFLDERLRIDDEYFNNLKELFQTKEDELMSVLVDLEENLPLKNYTLEEVIGNDDELSTYIETLIDDNHVEYEDALKIRQQIKEEYEAGMILNESLLIRLAYLFDEKNEPTLTAHSETCPYCNMPVDDHDRICHFCGINLNYDFEGVEKSILESISDKNPTDNFKEDIRYISYKFLKLLKENIKFDYAAAMVENSYGIKFLELEKFLNANQYLSNNNLSEKGVEFLKNHPLHYYDKYNMNSISYDEFEKYFWQNNDLNPKDICLTFLDKYDDDEDILDIKKEIMRN